MWDKFENVPRFEKSSKLGISDLHVTRNLANNYLESEREGWRDTTELEIELKEFLQRQENENRELIQRMNPETREELDVEKMILYVQNACYEWLWIDCILENNNDILKFVKWIVDWFAFEYIEALYDLIESWLDEFIEWLKSLLNVDTILELIKSIWDDFEDIYNVLENPYDWWKAIWWLGLWMVRFLKLWNVLRKIDWNDDRNEKWEDSERRDSHDNLDWNFKFKDVNAKFDVVLKEVESLASAIDIEYLLASPWRIKELIKNIYFLSKYINANKVNVLWSKDIMDLKYSLSDMRRNITKISWDARFSNYEILLLGKAIDQIQNTRKIII